MAGAGSKRMGGIGAKPAMPKTAMAGKPPGGPPPGLGGGAGAPPPMPGGAGGGGGMGGSGGFAKGGTVGLGAKKFEKGGEVKGDAKPRVKPQGSFE
jgi:translation initiation factor IF-2